MDPLLDSLGEYLVQSAPFPVRRAESLRPEDGEVFTLWFPFTLTKGLETDEWLSIVREWTNLVVEDIERWRDETVVLCVSSCNLSDVGALVHGSIFAEYALPQIAPYTPPRS